MTICTNCVKCNRPILVGVGPGRWAPYECESCGKSLVIEMSRIGGKTYIEDTFVEDVLPNLDDVERIDHPSGEAHVYADPDKIGIK